MTDLVKLIAADRPVRLLPDEATAEDARKLHALWLGDVGARLENDLSSVSDAELHNVLEAAGIDSEMPRSLGRIAPTRDRARPAAIALAACLAGMAVTAGVLWQDPSPEPPVLTAQEPAPDLVPYVLARPDRPAAGARQTAEPDQRSGLQAVADGRVASGGDLTRAEVHEMQRLLNRLGYGPLIQNGLPSNALDEAISRFHADRGLDPDEQWPREGLVMVRLAARVEELRAPTDENDPKQGE